MAPLHVATLTETLYQLLFPFLQVHRLLNNVELALEDLNTALLLSCGRGTSAEQAYIQRGLIRRLHGKDDEAKEDFTAAAKLGSKFAQKQVSNGYLSPPYMLYMHHSPSPLQLVQMNPYAALCSQMLSQAFDKLKNGEAT